MLSPCSNSGTETVSGQEGRMPVGHVTTAVVTEGKRRQQVVKAVVKYSFLSLTFEKVLFGYYLDAGYS